MKKILFLCGLWSCVMGLYARGIREDVQLADEKTRLSYALGLVMGADFEPGVLLDLDYAAFAEGLKTAVEKGEAPMSNDDAYEMVQAALERAITKQAEENQLKETQFLAENGARSTVRTTASGLQYEVLAEGEGEKPGPDAEVRVNYEGSLADGTVFDSSYERGESEELPLDGIIVGLAEGLQLMNTGGKYRFFIPHSLAYRETGAGPIPPYSTVIFTVELLEIIKTTEPESE